MIASLETELSKLIDLDCWGIIAGAGTGSMITLDFGEHIRFDPPLRNQRISSELRNFHGEYSIFVEGCAWRLEKEEVIVCGSRDDEEFLGVELERSLVGSKLTSAKLSNWAFDLDLSFHGGYVLRLFCDQTSTSDGLNNYSVRSPSGWITVGPKSKLVMEAAPGPAA